MDFQKTYKIEVFSQIQCSFISRSEENRNYYNTKWSKQELYDRSQKKRTQIIVTTSKSKEELCLRACFSFSKPFPTQIKLQKSHWIGPSVISFNIPFQSLLERYSNGFEKFSVSTWTGFWILIFFEQLRLYLCRENLVLLQIFSYSAKFFFRYRKKSN